MGFISKIKANIAAKKQQRNLICDEYVLKLAAANSEALRYFVDDEYTELSVVDTWKSKHEPLRALISSPKIKSLKKADNYAELTRNTDIFIDNFQNLRIRIETYNNELAKKQIKFATALIGDVEGRKLDEQQMLCIVKKSHNHLVIAGAGTGKTTTVVGKVKYLLKSVKCKPEEILVLSFTNASATEMNERINKETGCNISASTFHKLGLNIIAKADGVKPNITQINLRAFIKEKLNELMKAENYLRNLSNYLLYNKVSYKSEFDFQNNKEYEEYLKLNPPETFLGERVKSYGEMDIANFLFQNGISYQYEAAYKFDTRSEEYAQYHPDFYLPEYDVYIEYFGINKNREVPSYFVGKNGKSATETYRESMNWKFKLHKENNTKMVASYSYEKMDGSLLENLGNNLRALGITFEPKTPEEIWKALERENQSVLDGLIELFETVINLIKSNNYTIDYFKTLAQNPQQLAFIDLIKPLINAYNEELNKNSEIDFNDMINLAAEYVRCGKYKHNYTYVIVDEYQDISRARYQLLFELRKSSDYELFCVGDDWQSIYRFAGSDINYILNFEKYWGKTTISKIETTYRFSSSLSAISSYFIMHNPSQIKKEIKCKSTDKRFALGEISGYNEKYAVDFMVARIADLPKKASVFFIGRYSHDIKILEDSGLFEISYNNISGFIDVCYRKRPDLKMCFLTAHKSKGLQADYVFIINNKSSRMGFPSQIQDDPILNLLLDNSEFFPFAEERRLYYVSLTRAKIKTFILVLSGKESVFAQELQEFYKDELKREHFECPDCGGRLLRKTGPYGDFFGCENFKTTGCRYKRNIQGKV